MFTSPSIPSREILTRYLAPFGLTALLRPPENLGQAVDSFWIGSQGESGIVLFLSALDAEIYRLQALSHGEKWVCHPLETIGLQRSVMQLGQAWTNLVFGFNANAYRHLTLGPSGCLLLPYFPECFGPLDRPSESLTFEFSTSLFETIEHQWALTGASHYAETVRRLNGLGATRAGAVELHGLAERASNLAKLGPIGESPDELTDWAVFSPDADAWCFGPNQRRQILH